MPGEMGRYGKLLAVNHITERGCAAGILLKALDHHEKTLHQVHGLLASGHRGRRRMQPATEWLLDNFYLVSGQLAKTKKHFPKTFHKELPGLVNGLPHIPRIYDVTLKYLLYSSGKVSAGTLTTFINSYQDIKPLLLAEIWAIPIMLKLGLFHHLQQLALRMADNYKHEAAAHDCLQHLIKVQHDPAQLAACVQQLLQKGKPLEPSYTAELIQQLRKKGADRIVKLVKEQITARNLSVTDIMRMKLRQQAADQEAISNYITSLRMVAAHDWRDFVEACSLVHHALRQDPHHSYHQMEFPTRDKYRQVVSRLAVHSALAEHELAMKAVQLSAMSALSHGVRSSRAHVGYYLVGEGLPALEAAAGIKLSVTHRCQRMARRHALLLYFTAIASVTVALSMYLTAQAAASAAAMWVALAGIAALLSASQVAVHLVNWISSFLVKPSALPRMDYSQGLPAQARTLVVVPCMLGNAAEVEQLVNMLEIRYLANRGRHIHFGLLTDLRDAAHEHADGDGQLVQLAQRRISALNDKYGGKGQSIFYLFHRPRRWNAADKVWMGYERKRGKLEELNQLLRGGATDRFAVIEGDAGLFPLMKYVITLDADTQLPRDAAWKMVGTMSHPLNSAVYDAARQKVTEGYGILQPRIAVSMPPEDASQYGKMHGHDTGIDPYTHASSDVYQDLFREGSFIGKGIYDIDVFMKAGENAFPENRILSHDLIEGCYARAGLLNDVLLYEHHPVSYHNDVKRRRRWIRGDWQIASWALPFLPVNGGRFVKKPLSALSHWKIFDNLRRSLVPPALLLLLVLGATVLGNALFWTSCVAGAMLLPALLSFAGNVSRRIRYVLYPSHWKDAVRNAAGGFLQGIHALACLPYEAWYTLDAIVRTAWRVMISRRNLLEWEPSQNTQPARMNGWRTYRRLWPCPAAGILLAALLFAFPASLPAMLPIALLWTAAPLLTCLLNKPSQKKDVDLTAAQQQFLHRMARKTWSFFENFVGPHDHWLPPDNFQEYPVKRITHRTSPTNIGLSLLSALAARDFGYITGAQLLERSGHTMNTLSQLERYKGHFYNWYDTQSLKPVSPKYISTVDSGNFAGHLLTFRQGILEVPHQKLFDASLLQGLRSLLLLMRPETMELELLKEFASVLDIALQKPPATLTAAISLTKKLSACTKKIVQEMGKEHPDLEWGSALDRQAQAMQQDLQLMAPWANVYAHVVQPDITSHFNAIPSLAGLPAIYEQLQRMEADAQWKHMMQEPLQSAGRVAAARLAAVERIAAQCTAFSSMDYDFLYNAPQRLMSIGYHVEEDRVGKECYDLLASEARLAAFVAIAQGRIPEESWFAMGRPFASIAGSHALLSWSGSMFEYLMPQLVMPVYKNSLLEHANKVAVERQVQYGKQHGMLWGVSECAYNAIDIHLNYQYSASGVPELGLKRGLGQELVIAPYASMLALLVAPAEACANLQQLSAAGCEGRFGYYEAMEYSRAIEHGVRSTGIVRSFMAHHQGMSLLSLNYILLDKPMPRRFAGEPELTATLLLLQERIPYAGTTDAPPAPAAAPSLIADAVTVHEDTAAPAIVHTPNTTMPEVQLLSNGRYHVMVTNAGSGYSRWKDMAVTRWREDATCDDWGNYCFIRDIEAQLVFSATHQPVLQQADHYEADFSKGGALFLRKDGALHTRTQVAVSPEDDMEIRRVTITNHATVHKQIEITSYAEASMAAQAADVLHPAFSKMFVETQILSARHAIICRRRPRSHEEPALHLFHVMKIEGAAAEAVSYETDRMQFIGRGHSIHRPKAMEAAGPLAGGEGPVLDPVAAIRYRVTIAPGATITADLVWGMQDSREACDRLVHKCQEAAARDHALALSATYNEAVCKKANCSPQEIGLYTRLAGSIIFPNASLRAAPDIIEKNMRGQSALWTHGVSGDLPIVLLRIKDPAHIDMAEQLIAAHAYWREKGLIADLVIWNEDEDAYREFLQSQIQGFITASVSAELVGRAGGVFAMNAAQLSPQDRILFQTVARIVIADNGETLARQLSRLNQSRAAVPRAFTPALPYQPSPPAGTPLPKLLHYNGFGGFAEDGGEYVVAPPQGQHTPMPWVNVIANPQFGTVVSERGRAYTWFANAQVYRLTPWHNDAVTDSCGEAVYLRDEEDGHYWQPAALGMARHGFGYSVFEGAHHGIRSDVTVFVDAEAPVKFTLLRLRNVSGRRRRITLTGYVEWVLESMRSRSMPHIITEKTSGALLARNPFHADFVDHVSFFAVSGKVAACTADRASFIGRNGTMEHPAAMKQLSLSGKAGACLDPCAALQVDIELAEGAVQEVVFVLGTGKDRQASLALLKQFAGVPAAKASLESVCAYWKRTLGGIRIATPDSSLDMMVNGWLMYQAISARLWGRTGYYQSGGAFGFRDQLQDVLSLLHVDPSFTRSQLLLCAARQFAEGDVLHWWHPPAGKGLRSHCSDDFLWLPFVTCKYIQHTGDWSILDETTPFLEGCLLNLNEEASYGQFMPGAQPETLYIHCLRAIQHGTVTGAHGLPLIGTGDWNDSMNKVGRHGKGESVWLGFFLYHILNQFEQVAQRRNDQVIAEFCRTKAAALKGSIELHGWDGAWYRRAYFDNGRAIGSAENAECSIDSISQSWSVLSGAADAGRARMAMEAAYKKLVNHRLSVVQLLDPPFNASEDDPGYIKGYVPGLRENGGQYTHAATWMAMACAALGNGSRAVQLLSYLNPINHASDPGKVAAYRVEPYVTAADIYTNPQHEGRGGWTWYTGSAGWMYQAAIEGVLGLQPQENKLRLAPCLPAGWERAEAAYRYGQTMYHITIRQERAEHAYVQLCIDGVPHDTNILPLVDDGGAHTVTVSYANPKTNALT